MSSNPQRHAISEKRNQPFDEPLYGTSIPLNSPGRHPTLVKVCMKSTCYRKLLGYAPFWIILIQTQESHSLSWLRIATPPLCGKALTARAASPKASLTQMEACDLRDAEPDRALFRHPQGPNEALLQQLSQQLDHPSHEILLRGLRQRCNALLKTKTWQHPAARRKKFIHF